MLCFETWSEKAALFLGTASVVASSANADLLKGNASVFNDSLVAQEFVFTFTAPVSSPWADAVAGGSIAGSITDLNGDGAQLWASSGSSIYSALVDGDEIAALLPSPFAVSSGPFMGANFGPASFGDPIPSFQVGPVNTNFQIVLRFFLSAGDSATITSNLVVEQVVPAPGVLGVAALAGGLLRRRRRAACAGIAAAAMFAPGASADLAPQVLVDLQVDSASSQILPPGVATGSPGTYQYAGASTLAGDHSFSFNFVGTDVAVAGRALVGGSFLYTNASAESQWVRIDISLPTSQLGNTSLVGGSISGTLSANGDGGFIALGPAGMTSLWNGSIGNSSWDLLSQWGGTSASAYGSAVIPSSSFGLPGPSAPGPTLGQDARIRLSFILSAGDTVGLSTAFVAQPVPAPGAIALVALAGCMRRRRR